VIAHSTGASSHVVNVLAVLAIGLLVGLLATLGVAVARPTVIAIYSMAIILALPTFVVRDPRAYWLFLLVLSIPIDLSKPVTTWIMDPLRLLREYGLPPMETLSLDIYATDVVLFAMLLPWLARLCLRRDRLYFPRIGYVAVLYFVYTLADSFRAVSFYLAIFEWCREFLYFLAFVYLINNVATRSQLRAVVLALLVGLAIESGTVIAFFHLDIGTGTPLFSTINSKYTNRAKIPAYTLYAGESGKAAQIKRSAGTFGHPALTAYYLEFILPIVLGCLVTARQKREQILFGAIFTLGWMALYLTFSRSGLVGCIWGIFVFFAVAPWARLISRSAFTWAALVLAICATLGAPLAVQFLWSRPEAASYRLGLLDKGITAFWQRPILGAGLNNGSAVLEGARRLVELDTGEQAAVFKLHNHYLVVFVEDGLIGFLLFFTFFGSVVATAFHWMRVADQEAKLVLVGIVAALASIAVHNLGDPFQSHVTSAMLWLYAALVVATSRRVEAEPVVPEVERAEPLASGA
jgi:O-antigen ligase